MTDTKEVKVTLLVACEHNGEPCEKGAEVSVTQGQKAVMQAHGLVAKDKGAN